MRDTHRRARAIQQGLMQCFQPQPTGQRERHRTTLVALICGVVGGQRQNNHALSLNNLIGAAYSHFHGRCCSWVCR
jgi:hypothetical protein